MSIGHLSTEIAPFHDFHVTHTTFHYNDQSKSMEITIKVAIEDLEKSIKEMIMNNCINSINQYKNHKHN